MLLMALFVTVVTARPQLSATDAAIQSAVDTVLQTASGTFQAATGIALREASNGAATRLRGASPISNGNLDSIGPALEATANQALAGAIEAVVHSQGR